MDSKTERAIELAAYIMQFNALVKDISAIYGFDPLTGEHRIVTSPSIQSIPYDPAQYDFTISHYVVHIRSVSVVCPWHSLPHPHRLLTTTEHRDIICEYVAGCLQIPQWCKKMRDMLFQVYTRGGIKLYMRRDTIHTYDHATNTVLWDAEPCPMRISLDEARLRLPEIASLVDLLQFVGSTVVDILLSDLHGDRLHVSYMPQDQVIVRLAYCKVGS